MATDPHDDPDDPTPPTEEELRKAHEDQEHVEDSRVGKPDTGNKRLDNELMQLFKRDK